ncbi:MAG: protocatechuate 3,4-dioxygenase subunit alpha [Alphaproteobacteria bacterium HGW-Alphaproteobacteria-8]|nr:MAG: protocatechuate 3,4-dioxygenase subunit alpha [Alphaproteobacteria bacterium HGW-Alphaproteobacteria-8]
MTQPLHYLPETPSQTAGPYVHIGLAPQAAGLEATVAPLGLVIAGPDTPGARIRVEGRVIDGLGAVLKDVLIEVWQADSAGRHADGRDPRVSGDFKGWGRVVPDFETGIFAFETIKPGPTASHGGRTQAPHLSLWIVARGINIGLQTRMYFPDEDNAADPVLNRIEHVERRATLIAAADGPGRYRFDIRLQGADETVFLDI